MDRNRFVFEKLIVWQKAMDFAEVIISYTESLQSNRNHYKLVEQLESCAISVAMNIAEGRGRQSTKAYILHLTYARGSLYEALTITELMSRKKWISSARQDEARQLALEVVKMINKLISSLNQKLTTT